MNVYQEIGGYFDRAARQYEFSMDKQMNDELEAGEDLKLQTDEWKLEVEETLDLLTVDTKYGDSTYKKVIENMELILGAIKDYCREGAE